MVCVWKNLEITLNDAFLSFEHALEASKEAKAALIRQHQSAHQTLVNTLAPELSESLDHSAQLLDSPALLWARVQERMDAQRQYLSQALAKINVDSDALQAHINECQAESHDEHVHRQSLADALVPFHQDAEFMALLDTALDENVVWRMSGYRRQKRAQRVAARFGFSSFADAEKQYRRLFNSHETLKHSGNTLGQKITAMTAVARSLFEKRRALQELEHDTLQNVRREISLKLAQMSVQEMATLAQVPKLVGPLCVFQAVTKKRIYLVAIDEHLLSAPLLRIPDLLRDVHLAQQGDRARALKFGRSDDEVVVFGEKLKRQTHGRKAHHDALSQAIVSFADYDPSTEIWWDKMCGTLDAGNYIDDVIASRLSKSLAREAQRPSPIDRAELAQREFERRLQASPTPVDYGDEHS